MTVIGEGPPPNIPTAVAAGPPVVGLSGAGAAPDPGEGVSLRAAPPRPIVAGWLATTNASPILTDWIHHCESIRAGCGQDRGWRCDLNLGVRGTREHRHRRSLHRDDEVRAQPGTGNGQHPGLAVDGDAMNSRSRRIRLCRSRARHDQDPNPCQRRTQKVSHRNLAALYARLAGERAQTSCAGKGSCVAGKRSRSGPGQFSNNGSSLDAYLLDLAFGAVASNRASRARSSSISVC